MEEIINYKLPLVSIITPTFNHEKYLVECIESVLNQTYSSWEMLIVNDGSSDNTAQVAQHYVETDSRIQLINQENIGIFRLEESYNKALHKSKGKYIAVLEGDDTWCPEKLEKQVAILEQHPEAVVCWGQAVSMSGGLEIRYEQSPAQDSDEAKFFNNDPVGSIINVFLYHNCIPALTLLIRKEPLLSFGGFQQGFGLPLVDLPTLYELALKGKFYFLPEVLGTWRIYATQVTKTYPVNIIKGFYLLSQSFIERIKDNPVIHINRKDLDLFYTKRIISYSAMSGRYKLIRKDFKSARKDYWISIRTGGFNELIWKLRALTGLIFSCFGWNVEGLAKFLKKKHYSIQ